MEYGRPSQTALTAAAARAAHRIVDGEPRIFDDPLAESLLGKLADDLLSYHRKHGAHLVLATARAQVVTRSRYAEDQLARLARRGVRQYVILGAGLDSFAHRNAAASGIRVFEVDHPSTQEWKRAALADAGIAIPDSLALVPADAEAGALGESLAAAGFDPDQPAFVSWLGVTMYLTRSAIEETLGVVGVMAPGTELVADHMLPAGLRDRDGDEYVEQVSPRAAERGEPWLTFLAPAELAALLTAHGFAAGRHLSQRDAVGSAMWDRSDALRPVALSMIAHATVAGRT